MKKENGEMVYLLTFGKGFANQEVASIEARAKYSRLLLQYLGKKIEFVVEGDASNGTSKEISKTIPEGIPLSISCM